MENASKALLIAGGLLIAILIITTGIILYNNFSDTTKRYSDNLSATELAKFNTNFEVFRGRTDITAQEIASLINIVAEYKEKTPMNVKVLVGNEPIEPNRVIDFLKKNIKSTYSCENNDIKYEEGQVGEISFNWYIEPFLGKATQSEVLELVQKCFCNGEVELVISFSESGRYYYYSYNPIGKRWQVKEPGDSYYRYLDELDIIEKCKDRLDEGKNNNVNVTFMEKTAMFPFPYVDIAVVK